MSVSERFRKHEEDELVRRKQRETRARTSAKLIRRYEEGLRDELLNELSSPVIAALKDIRDNIWGVGEISQTEPEVDRSEVPFTGLPVLRREVILETGWPKFISGGETGTRGEFGYVRWPDHIEKTSRRLKMKLEVNEGGFRVLIDGEGRLRDAKSLDETEDHLFADCLERKHELPYTYAASQDLDLILERISRGYRPDHFEIELLKKSGINI